MECHLVLTALSGTVVNITMSVAKFDRFEDLEDHVVDYLASVTDLKVFGRTIDFLQADTQNLFRKSNLGKIATEHRVYHSVS